MGHGTRPVGFDQVIKTFWPDDQQNTIYIEREASFEDIWQRILSKWPGIMMSELNMEAQYIHTNHLTYDQYDSSDYTNFLCITASESYFERMKKNG